MIKTTMTDIIRWETKLIKSNSMKQTAVDYLFERLSSLYLFKDALLAKKELEKAKEMEKKQIVDAYLKSVQHECDGLDNIETASIKEDAENYYTETYKP